MRFFHTLGVYFYGLIIFLAQPFSPKAKLWVNGRKNFWRNLPNIHNKEVIWFHCASLGEFDQGIPVMQELKKEKPSAFLIVTFFSPSGMEHYHKRNHPADWVGYLPLPTPNNARKFISHFQPKQVFFVKYEFWVNYLKKAKNISAKTYCISANFRPNQLFFGPFKFIFSSTLFLFDKIFVQNSTSLFLLESISYKQGVIVGDTRIDKVLENKKNIYSDALVEQFLQGNKAIILGSSWSVDEALWQDYILSHPEQKFIIAPHDISQKHISHIQLMFPLAACYSQGEKINSSSTILIVDCIGKLSNLYQYASLAYIGGGFTGKLHNLLEAAVFHIPVIIGPKYTRFPEAQLLIDKNVVYSVSAAHELVEIIGITQSKTEQITASAIAFFEENKNASKRICLHL